MDGAETRRCWLNWPSTSTIILPLRALLCPSVRSRIFCTNCQSELPCNQSTPSQGLLLLDGLLNQLRPFSLIFRWICSLLLGRQLSKPIRS